MNDKNKYIIKFDGVKYHYFKNGWLHRENGPAIFWAVNADMYLDLDDKNLYTLKNVELDTSYGFTHHTANFYLDGLQYSEVQFNQIIKKRNAEKLQKELSNQLKINAINNKKIKV